MPHTNPPDKAKERVREYLERRQEERRQETRPPLHDLEQIRREIGWEADEEDDLEELEGGERRHNDRRH